MKFFIDTANINEIKQVAEWGLVDGVTTNPSLAAKEGRPYKETVLEIASIIDGPISVEVVGENAEEMLQQARTFATWHPNVVVKLPMTPDGMKVLRKVAPDGIRVNVTLIFSVNQALIAAKAGATYLSNFVGRVDDMGGDGMVAVRDTVNMVHEYEFQSEVLVASIRSPQTVVESVRAGAHIATIPFKVLEQMYGHPLTDIGLERFSSDWKKAGLKLE
jgi:transaldolase